MDLDVPQIVHDITMNSTDSHLWIVNGVFSFTPDFFYQIHQRTDNFNLQVFHCLTESNLTTISCLDPFFGPINIPLTSLIVDWTYGELHSGAKVLALITLDDRTMIHMFTMDG